MIKRIDTIRFIETKGGHLTAIINNEYSVVKYEDGYKVYPNIAKGKEVEEKLKEEFIEAYHSFVDYKLDQISKAFVEHKKELMRHCQELRDKVKDMTPYDLCEANDINYCETAKHWSDLHEGRSGFAIIIDNDETYRLIQEAEIVNKWEGNFGEIKHRAGEHHSTFIDYYSIENFRNSCKNRFESFFWRDKDTEKEYCLERIKGCTDIDEVKKTIDDCENIEPGYYSAGDVFICGEVDDDFWGYNEDVYSYGFGYNFKTKKEFYDGKEE